MLATAAAVLVAGALPAGALASGGVVADAKPWHYWISFLLAAGFILSVLALAVAYYVKVLRLKYRGR